VTRTFKTDGAAVVLLGDNSGELGGSEYLATIHGKVAGKPPAIDLKREAALQALIVKLIRDGCIESAHDCSEGGLAITLAECTFDTGGLGVSANITSVAAALTTSVTGGWARRSRSTRRSSANRPLASLCQRRVVISMRW
jgi:phosphoribosylformylglycinamidine (FGAM) synthase-like enzyme